MRILSFYVALVSVGLFGCAGLGENFPIIRDLGQGRSLGHAEPVGEMTKLMISSARASNSYSNTYNAQKSVDGNIASYWSTASGAILDVKIDYFFQTPQEVGRIRVLSSQRGGEYAVPRTIVLRFFDESDVEVNAQQITLNGPYKTWQQKSLDIVSGVSRIQVSPIKLTKEVASYLTIDEIEFHRK